MSQTNPAILVLADGTVFRGISIGAEGSRVGEVVFNTSMFGYQEILTDPSYCKQIVTLTYPHIGNVGVNVEDVESRQVFASGLVIRDLSQTVSNWRSTHSLPEFLKANKVVAIADIDTRKLTRILREKGAQNGCVATGTNETAALAAARAFAGLSGMDLAKEVTCDKSYTWAQREWNLKTGYTDIEQTKYHVVAYDFGVKHNILRKLANEVPLNEAALLHPELSFQIASGLPYLELRQALLQLKSETERLRRLADELPVFIERQTDAEHIKKVAPRNGHGPKPPMIQ